MRRAALALGITLALYGRAAPAQTPTPEELAEGHFQRGRRMEEDGRAAEAIAEYRQALAIEETPAGYVRLGGALRTLGRYREAIAALEHALTLTEQDPSYRSLAHAATSTIHDLRESLAFWAVNATPTDASVSLDGERVTGTERWHEADPGNHVLVVQSPGHGTVTRALSLVSGVHEEVPVVLPANEVAGRLRVEAEPRDARIRIDGQEVGHGMIDEPLTEGSHSLDVEMVGFDAFHRQIEISPGDVRTVRAVLSDRRPITSSPWFWAGVSAAVAGVVVGAVLLFSSTEPEFHGTFYGTVPSGIMVRP